MEYWIFATLALVAAAGSCVTAFIIMRAQERMVAQLVEHLKSSGLVGGDRVDLVEKKLQLEDKRLQIEAAKQRFFMEQASKANGVGPDSWSR